MKRIGLVVNPVAGIGGRAGLKGSDSPSLRQKALAAGFLPAASHRAACALSQLIPVADQFRLFTASGSMGLDAVNEAGLSAACVGEIRAETTPEDTVRIARLLADMGMELILFSGGDGTARDLCVALGRDTPVLGIPAGVKMHSGVFAHSPVQAGLLVRDWVLGRVRSGELREVMDIDETLFSQGRVSARLYGYLLVPSGDRLQHTKESSHAAADELSTMAGQLANLLPGERYFIGPGSTTMAILERLGIPGTLLGVDVVQDGALLAADADEPCLYRLATEGVPTNLIVTAIGGQGHVFGRGNQQLSPRVIRAVGISRIALALTPSKLASLQGRPLLTDTGDESLDRELCGYYRIPFGPGQFTYYRVAL